MPKWLKISPKIPPNTNVDTHKFHKYGSMRKMPKLVEISP